MYCLLRLTFSDPCDAVDISQRLGQQAHQPQGWKQAGSEILRSLRVPRGVYREEKPPPAKASDGVVPKMKDFVAYRRTKKRWCAFEEIESTETGSRKQRVVPEEHFHRYKCHGVVRFNQVPLS